MLPPEYLFSAIILILLNISCLIVVSYHGFPHVLFQGQLVILLLILLGKL